MPFIEIITDSKSQTQLNKVITKKMVNDCDILFIKDKNIEKDLLGNKKNKKSFNKSHNNGVFRNNYKNYQYDYEEDFYEPY